MAIIRCFFSPLATKKKLAAWSSSTCCSNCLPLRLNVLHGHRGLATWTAMLTPQGSHKWNTQLETTKHAQLTQHPLARLWWWKTAKTRTKTAPWPFPFQVSAPRMPRGPQHHHPRLLGEAGLPWRVQWPSQLRAPASAPRPVGQLQRPRKQAGDLIFIWRRTGRTAHGGLRRTKQNNLGPKKTSKCGSPTTLLPLKACWRRLRSSLEGATWKLRSLILS